MMHNEMPHLRRTGNHTQLVVDGKPFTMLAGEVHNSSSSSLDYMQMSWRKMAAIGCNTAIVPLCWELVEPEEGVFDFTLLDGLVRQARGYGMKIVLLWFATWKNATATYAPAWVKTDAVRFTRAEVAPGEPICAISSLCEEARSADARAFAAVMRRIRELDQDERTVVMVQVQNEAGLLGADRDYCALAQQAYTQLVDANLMAYLQSHELQPELAAGWYNAGQRTQGTWAQVFGEDAAEVFMAWHIGRYVETVAAAGKAEYALPMFVNAWLVQHRGQPAGQYPSGGPVSRMLDVWRAAAPSIDLVAPDIYLPCFKQVCADYARGGNPLLIPEAAVSVADATVFYALAQHDALGFAPFGIDGDYDHEALARAYEFVTDMLPIIQKYQGTGQMVGILQEQDGSERIPLGDYVLEICYHHCADEPTRGRGLVIAVQPNEYIVAGAGYHVRFHARQGDLPRVDFLAIDEGRFTQGEWRPSRRLNGDEYGVRFGDTLNCLNVKLYSY